MLCITWPQRVKKNFIGIKKLKAVSCLSLSQCWLIMRSCSIHLKKVYKKYSKIAICKLCLKITYSKFKILSFQYEMLLLFATGPLYELGTTLSIYLKIIAGKIQNHLFTFVGKWEFPPNSRISLGMHPANKRHRYNVTMSPIGWAHT